VACRLQRPDQFIQLEVDGTSIAVLRVLNEKHHQKSNDCRSRIYDELPRIAVMK